MKQTKTSPCIWCHSEPSIKNEGLCWLCKHEHYTKKRLQKQAETHNNDTILLQIKYIKISN